MRMCGSAIFVAAVLVAWQIPAQAGTSFTNGNFASSSDATLANGQAVNIYGGSSANTWYTLTGWSECVTASACPSATASTTGIGNTSALAFLYTYGSQAQSITDTFGTNNFTMADSAAIPNTWTGAPCTGGTPAANCGNYIAIDGDSGYDMGLYQTLTGLTANTTYQITFYMAGGQQSSASGATTEDWQVYLGSSVQTTSVLNTASKGFSPWSLVTMNFTTGNTITPASQVILEFLALGGPNGDPPMDFLADVNLTQVAAPEPAGLALIGAGMLGLVLMRKRWQKRA